jgi:hypothetical protein
MFFKITDQKHEFEWQQKLHKWLTVGPDTSQMKSQLESRIISSNLINAYCRHRQGSRQEESSGSIRNRQVFEDESEAQLQGKA